MTGQSYFSLSLEIISRHISKQCHDSDFALINIPVFPGVRRSDNGSLGGGQVDGLDAGGQGFLQVL